MSTKLVPSGGFRGEFVLLPFQGSRNCLHSLALISFLHLQNTSLQHLLLLLHLHSILSCLPLIKTLMVSLTPTQQSRIISHFKILSLIPSAKALLPLKTIYSQAVGIRRLTFFSGETGRSEFFSHHTKTKTGCQSKFTYCKT